MKSRVCAAVFSIAFAFAVPASAVVRVIGDRPVGVREIDVVLGHDGRETTTSVAVRVDLRGRRVAVLAPISAAPKTTRPLTELDALAAALRTTGPRLEEYRAKDPCADINDLYHREPQVKLPPVDRATARGEFRIEVLTRARVPSLRAWSKKEGLQLDPASEAALRPVLERGGAIVALIGRIDAPGRGRWLPGIQWSAAGIVDALPLRLAADQTSPGKLLTVRLITAHPSQLWAPAGELVDAASQVSLPEVAFESPADLVKTAFGHALRRAGRDAVLRGHTERDAAMPESLAALGMPKSAIIARFEVQAGRKGSAEPVAIAPRTFTHPHFTRWWFRRVWRGKLACPAAARYANIVSIQQRAELRSYNALTGRSVDGILQQSRERGYAARPDGTLRPVEVRR